MTVKILFVDDEPNALNSFERGLKGLFDVHTAISGENGLTKLDTHDPFAVVISDLQMPGMDGIEFLGKVRESAPNTICIMLTGKADLQAAIDAVNEGNVFRFHTKPCPLKELSQSIDEAVAHYQHQNSIASENNRLSIEREKTAWKLQQALEQTARANERATAIVNTVTDGIFTMDKNGYIDSINMAAQHLSGYTIDEVIGKNISILLTGSTSLRSLLQDQNSHAHVNRSHPMIRHKSGKNLPAEWSFSETCVDDQIFVTGVVRDISERLEAERTLRRLALTDSLTGLPNRNMFHTKLEKALQAAERDTHMVGLMFLDLDQFKKINDTFGHPVGDSLLKEVGQLLRSDVRNIDTLARLGGDEFAVILTQLSTKKAAEETATTIIKRLSQPLKIGSTKVITGTSIGISFYPDDGMDADQLIKTADLSLYQAKASGRGTYRLYDNAIYAEAKAREILKDDLQRALEKSEFILHYQPQFDFTTRQICGVEALLRWRRAHQSIVPPDEFIPIAESSGLIIPIGEWALRTACSQNKSWQELGLPPVRVAVNISARQFRGNMLVAMIEQILSETGLDPQWLELEITESVFMSDADEVLDKLSRLSRLGIHLTIDDFGTGYSSLSYLKRFPIERLKIDRSFVIGIPKNPVDMAIAEAVVKLGHSLNLKVVAEGVESDNHLSCLGRMGCDEVQGFYLAEPIPGDQIARQLESGFLLATPPVITAKSRISIS